MQDPARGSAYVEAAFIVLVFASVCVVLVEIGRLAVGRVEAQRLAHGLVLIEGGRPGQLRDKMTAWVQAIDPAAKCSRRGMTIRCDLDAGRVSLSRQETPGRQSIQVEVRTSPTRTVSATSARYDVLPGGLF